MIMPKFLLSRIFFVFRTRGDAQSVTRAVVAGQGRGGGSGPGPWASLGGRALLLASRPSGDRRREPTWGPGTLSRRPLKVSIGNIDRILNTDYIRFWKMTTEYWIYSAHEKWPNKDWAKKFQPLVVFTIGENTTNAGNFLAQTLIGIEIFSKIIGDTIEQNLRVLQAQREFVFDSGFQENNNISAQNKLYLTVKVTDLNN